MSQMSALQREIAEAVRAVIREELPAILAEHKDQRPEYLTTNEAAEMLRVTPRTVRRWVEEGSIASVRRAGKLYIPREAVR